MQSVSQLVQVKQVREQSRQRESHSAVIRRDAAREELEASMQARLRADESRSRQERAHYDDLCARTVNVSDILLVGHHVGLLKLQAQEDLRKEQEAGAVLDRAQEQVLASGHALDAARVALTKTEALQAEMHQVDRIARTRAEDAGFDEVCELIDTSRRAQTASPGEAP
ncbi:hypothetical protein [uncultured Hydrogenophaga sp.]|uniref:hypothetical protein n=1 Tax=uncultured Hydrogenophaga sp. TaxID=199683 RepID=UPI00265D8592|nr:hypothetical protein [uncultured Hydrogenophaga sp.]